MHVHERHQNLVNSIGAMPEEQEAYEKLGLIISIGIPGLFIGSVFQFLSYIAFNRYFHPFKDIIFHEQPGKHFIKTSNPIFSNIKYISEAHELQEIQRLK